MMIVLTTFHDRLLDTIQNTLDCYSMKAYKIYDSMDKNNEWLDDVYDLMVGLRDIGDLIGSMKDMLRDHPNKD